jgi:hypothetical protein
MVLRECRFILESFPDENFIHRLFLNASFMLATLTLTFFLKDDCIQICYKYWSGHRRKHLVKISKTYNITWITHSFVQRFNLPARYFTTASIRWHSSLINSIKGSKIQLENMSTVIVSALRHSGFFRVLR